MHMKFSNRGGIRCIAFWKLAWSARKFAKSSAGRLLRFECGGRENGLMEGATRKRWNSLCEQAAVENDYPVKLIEIYRDIMGMLDEKASRLFRVWAQERL